MEKIIFLNKNLISERIFSAFNHFEFIEKGNKTDPRYNWGDNVNIIYNNSFKDGELVPDQKGGEKYCYNEMENEYDLFVNKVY